MGCEASFALLSDGGAPPEWGYKDTTTSVVARGDRLKVSSGAVIRMATTTDNLTFCGIVLDDSPAGENDGIRYIPNRGAGLDAEFEYALDTATACVKFEKLQWAANRQNSKSDTDPIMFCSHGNSGSGGETARCKMLPNPALFEGDAS